MYSLGCLEGGSRFFYGAREARPVAFNSLIGREWDRRRVRGLLRRFERQFRVRKILIF